MSSIYPSATGILFGPSRQRSKSLENGRNSCVIPSHPMKNHRRFSNRQVCPRPSFEKPRPSRRAGFVLVMVLVLVAVSGISLAGFARRSLESSAQASAAQTELQRRWGILSCLRLYLPAAESLLEAEGAKQPAAARAWPLPATVSSEFILRDLRFSVLVGDEDAKVSLNAIFRRRPDTDSQVATVVEPAASAAGLPAQIRPATDETSKREATPFRSWEQVFDLKEVGTPGEAACRLCDATRELTCWGSGRLNVRRASDQAIQLVCGDQVGPDVVGKLLALRRQPGINSLNDLLTRMALRTSDRAVLERLLTDRSSRYSLWIIVRSQRRTWAGLTVGRAGQQSGFGRETFTW
jgi:type II secretory pathway pseudopilin PulG